MKFFLDANMPISTLKVFEDLKLEAIHAKRIELNNAEDIELFNYAINNNCILVTKDIEFGNPSMFQLKLLPGLIILRLPFYFTAPQINKTLKDFLESIELKELKNGIAIIRLGRFRIRKL